QVVLSVLSSCNVARVERQDRYEPAAGYRVVTNSWIAQEQSRVKIEKAVQAECRHDRRSGLAENFPGDIVNFEDMVRSRSDLRIRRRAIATFTHPQSHET